MADEVMFGTPETWGMKVGEFLESKEYTIPQPKPQDVIEQRRKDSLRKFLFDYPGAVEQETVDYIKDYIKRENFGVKGTSKILASVCANKVFPHPVGPTKRIFDFDNSTFLLVLFS